MKKKNRWLTKQNGWMAVYWISMFIWIPLCTFWYDYKLVIILIIFGVWYEFSSRMRES